MNTPETDPWPSVPDHPAEVLFRDAGMRGQCAANNYQAALLCREAAKDRLVDCAIHEFIVAAGLYHEGLRESGICPMCGQVNTDPWGGIHYQTSVGCCIEPLDFDGFGGTAGCYAEQMEAARRLK